MDRANALARRGLHRAGARLVPRKRAGGILATVSLVEFYVWHLLERVRFPSGPYFLLGALPEILFQ